MKNKTVLLVVILVVLAAAIIFLPYLFLPDAEWEGSDDGGAEMVEEIAGDGFEPWFDPLIETAIGDELSEAAETWLFVLQGAIGAAVLIVCFAALSKRRKLAENEAS
jgi:cobalt/nickel transport protein